MIMKIDKYKVSEELMTDINEWRYGVHGLVVGGDINFGQLSSIYNWWIDNDQGISEKNNRLIALIQYVNGEDVFEVEKWVVRTKNRDRHRSYQYLTIYDEDNNQLAHLTDDAQRTSQSLFVDNAFKFDTKEEAGKWTNPLMEVVEVEDD